jgi:hypothetical protein
MAVVFAYVFADHLLIPVGQVFGSRSAPSYFSLMSDIRQEVASTVDLTDDCGDLEDLARTAAIDPLPPKWNPQMSLTQACNDAKHPILTPSELLCFANAAFVDNDCVASFRDKIRATLHQSVRAACSLFGFPWDDRRQSCLSADKWDPFVSFIVPCLGFYINSREMTVTWPLDKRVELSELIVDVLAAKNATSPRIIASVIGKLRSAAKIAPWGNFMSFSCQEALTAALRKSSKQSKWFWQDACSSRARSRPCRARARPQPA